MLVEDYTPRATPEQILQGVDACERVMAARVVPSEDPPAG
jgi:hypothetical protein